MKRARDVMTDEALKGHLIEATVYGLVVFALCLAVTAENWKYYVPLAVIVGFSIWKGKR